MVVKGVGAIGLEDESSIGSLFGRRFHDPLPPVFDITLTLPSCFGAAGAIWGLEIALGEPFFQLVGSMNILGGRGEKVKAPVVAIGSRLLTRTLRLLQVVQPLELPGIPTMLDIGALELALLDSEYEKNDNKREVGKGPLDA